MASSSSRTGEPRAVTLRQTSATQLIVLSQRMKDVEELEEKAIQEVMAELEAVDDAMTSELSELDAAGHRLNVIKQQQMELLLEAAKEREDADRQMAAERRRLQSMERRCRDTGDRLRSRDRGHVTSSTRGDGNDDDVDRYDDDDDDDDDDVMLRMALRRQQDAVECQRRVIDDLEFQLLETETRREAEREPFQKKLMAERSKLLQTCALRKQSLQALYLQKLELLAQTKADVADLGKEYQLLVEAFVQEKQKLNDSNRTQSAAGSQGSHRTTGARKYQPAELQVANGYDHLGETSPGFAAADPRCASPSSWKQGSLWRTLIELEAQVVNDRPPFNDDGDDDSQQTAMDDGTSRQQQQQQQRQSRDWAVDFNSPESEKSSDDVSCSGLSRDRDTGISSSGNTLDDIDDIACSRGSLRSSVEVPSEGNHLQNFTQQAGATQCYDDTWSRADVTTTNGASPDDSPTAGSSSKPVVYRKKRAASRQSRPMTRYLPVRDAGDADGPAPFNLRQFVESAGHTLDDRPDSPVHVTPVACHGWLVKLAGGRAGRLRVWHRRYFLFDRTWRTLSWYASRVNPSTVAPPPLATGSGSGDGRCFVPFGSIVDVFVDHMQRAGRSPAPPLTFCVKTRDRCIYVVAPSPEAMRIWIDVLVTGAEGYGEFL